jgi:hypothetical protein
MNIMQIPMRDVNECLFIESSNIVLFKLTEVSSVHRKNGGIRKMYNTICQVVLSCLKKSSRDMVNFGQF